jgi:uncharacterized protein YndB with AHSA1/START domain
MALLQKLAGAFLGVVLLIIGAGFLLPSDVHVERSRLIDAPPEKIFALISDFEEWGSWSPWAELDPDASMQITGSGMGQKMAWSSDNPQVGSGSQEITRLNAPDYLQTHLDFGPNGEADAAFQLIPVGDKTQVVWSLDADMREGVPFLKQPVNTYLGMLMDSMVGQDYETGLANLQALAES